MVTRRPRRAARALLLSAVLVIAGATRAGTADARAERHALHTTLAELRYEPAARAVRVTVRLFADDLGGALRRRGATAVPDSPAGTAATLAYVNEHFVLATANGRSLPLRLEGMRRTGDLIRITVSSAPVGGIGGLTLRNALLMELFTDQVNIVQVADGDSRRSLLFTRGAGSKRL